MTSAAPDPQSVITAASAAAGATVEILAFLPQATPEICEVHTVIEDLATAAVELLSLFERLDDDDNQLLGALQRWLP